MKEYSDLDLELSEKRRTLLDLLLSEESIASAPPDVIPKRVSAGTAPLSFAQERLWFIDQLMPGSPAYNLPVALRLSGTLDAGALRRSFNEIVRRHETLRTGFEAVDGKPAQVISPDLELEIPIVDLAGLSQIERETEAQRIADAESSRPFDLTRPPLMRVMLVKLAEDDNGFIVTMHHIISDAWSLGVLTREASLLYDAFSNGRPSPLPELPIQYADYATWQRATIQRSGFEEYIINLKERLAGELPVLDLPTDRPRPPIQTNNGASEVLALDEDIAVGLRSLAQSEGATLFMKLLAAFNVLLYRYSGRELIAVGTPIASRSRSELEVMIGFLVNTLLLVTRIDDRRTFRELLRRQKSVALEAFLHPDLPFEILVDELQPARTLSHSPLFQVAFNLVSATTDGSDSGGFGEGWLDIEYTTAKFDITLAVQDTGSELAALLEYNTDLFDRATITAMSRRFNKLLRAITEDPDRHLRDIPLLLDEEAEQVLSEWTETTTEYPRDSCIHFLFEEQVDRNPDAIAVQMEGIAVTYRELDRRANQLARYLGESGIGPETRVAICVERSIEMLVGLLGILKTGGAYVPLDPGYPLDRLSLMLDEIQAPVVLTLDRLADLMPAFALQLICLDSDWERIAAESDLPVERNVSAENLAYVMYTSGSTGRPKGVSINHRAVIRLVRGTSYVKLDDSPTMLGLAPISFDAATFEIWGSLLNGGTLVQAGPLTPSVADIVDTIVSNDVTTVWLTAALFQQVVDVSLNDLKGVRQLLAGGDVLPLAQVERVIDELPETVLINGYGPTENTTFTSCYQVRRRADFNQSVPIGRPIANTRVYIVDRQMTPVPIGVMGELAAAGDGLARGYFNDPEQTAERFIPDPFSRKDGERLYRTGDIVRYRRDGIIEFHGRTDTQVKLRGYRIELGEIESVLAKQPGVREAAVVARRENGNDRRLVAYVAGDRSRIPEPGNLRSSLRVALPEYMIPSSFVALEAMPLTPSGKIDRRSLPEADRGIAAADLVLPRNPVEAAMAAIWVDVLDCERVSVTDNFFELGGHSLLATQIISRLRDRFAIDLPLTRLFEFPTIESFASELSKEPAIRGQVEKPGAGAGADDEDSSNLALELSNAKRALLEMLLEDEAILPSRATSIPRRQIHSPVPLSFAQERLWFLDQLMPGNPFYNVPVSMRLNVTPDIAALRQAVNEIVRRHEVMRTHFELVEGRPVQVIEPDLEIETTVIDLSELDQSICDVEASRVAEAEATFPFNLSTGPMLRARLLRFAEDDWALLFTMHHIVSDAWSMRVLVREMSDLYDAFSEGNSSPLAGLPIQYADYAVWQRGWLSGELLESQLAYWRQQLAGAPPVLDLPADRPRPAMQSYRGDVTRCVLGDDLTELIKSMGREESATTFMVLLAAFKILLHRYTGQRTVVVGTPIAGRSCSELEPLIGFFINTLVMKTEISEAASFRDIVRRVKGTVIGAFDHEDLPFEKLVEELQPARSLSHAPICQVVFNYLAAERRDESDYQGQRGLGEDIQIAKFDLTMIASEAGQQLIITIRYSTDLFDPPTVERMLGHFKTLLEAGLGSPESLVRDLPLLTHSERRGIASHRDSTPVYRTPEAVHQIFERQTISRPDQVAIRCDEQSLTYADLNRRANRIAHHLRRLGVGPDIPVGICMERSFDLVAGMLAILKAGGAYVPLDPGHPAARLDYVLGDAKLPVVLISGSVNHDFAAGGAMVIRLDSEWDSLAGESDENPDGDATADNQAYVIYTSGSTGQPKGVSVTHSNLTRLLRATDEWFEFNESDVWTLFHSFAFDFSVWEIWGALLFGGRLVIVPHWVSRSPDAFFDVLINESVTVLNQTPSAFRQLDLVDERSSQADELALRLVIFGGEAVEFQGLRGWIERHGDNKPLLINMYGITETTVHVTYRPITAVDLEPATGSAIGVPIKDLEVRVLDQMLEPMPAGIPGEICVGGDGVARGYLGRPDLTAERFVPDRFAATPGSRIYRSGDLGRFKNSGELEYIGRIDRQVKIRGYRIELGEIEAVLSRHHAVKETAVIVRDSAPGEKRLVAYVVFLPDRRADTAELRSFLSGSLPDHMIPSSFVVLDRLPLTANGKVDREALAAGDQSYTTAGRDFIEPRNELELLLASRMAEALRLDRVGSGDDFFELGGDSIRAAVLVNRLQQDLGAIIHVVAVFDSPTVEKLASYLTKRYPEATSRLLGQDQTHSTGASGPTVVVEPINDDKLNEFRNLIVSLAPPRAVPAESKNPRAIFILAPPRSGTTLLRVMMAGNPRLFAPPELELLSFNTLFDRSDAFKGRDAFWLEGAIRAVMELLGCSAGRAKALVEDCEQVGLSTKRFYRWMQNRLGERILVDKTPSYALDLEILNRAETDFGEALYVHLLRSPQGMIKSFEESQLDQIFPRFSHPFATREVAEMIWVISQQNIMSFLSGIPSNRHHAVRFEDLVNEPEPALRRLCDFIGIEFNTEMLDPYRDKKKKMTDGIHKESHMLGDIKFHQHSAIDASVAESWRKYYAEDFLGDRTWQVAESLGYFREGFAPISQAAGDAETEQTIAQLDQMSDEELDTLLGTMLEENETSGRVEDDFDE